MKNFIEILECVQDEKEIIKVEDKKMDNHAGAPTFCQRGISLNTLKIF
jgi:hypothetical protein